MFPSLYQVADFNPKARLYYLNIIVRNIVKVLTKFLYHLAYIVRIL